MRCPVQLLSRRLASLVTVPLAALLAGGLVPSLCQAQELHPRDIDALPTSVPASTSRYGPDPQNVGEVRIPLGAGPFPVAIVIHGGCWTRGYATLRNTAPIATALAARGIATWNIEYRQVGDAGGGWPGTFQDWGAGVDHLRHLARNYPLDLARVIVIGHSAGAVAALWAASRDRLPRGSRIRGTDPLRVLGAVAIDGPVDLAGFIGADAEVCGKPVVVPLMGVTPGADHERYRQATPQALLPNGASQLLVIAAVMRPDHARTYQRFAAAQGDSVDILQLQTGHFEVIAPDHDAWLAIERWIVERLGGIVTRDAQPRR